MNPPGTRKKRRSGNAPTISDVAGLAGVSTQTVSRVLNGASNVRPHVKAAVEAAITSLRYTPNKAAQALAGSGSIKIGLLCNDLGAWFLSDLLMACLEEAKAHHAQIIVDNIAPGDDPLPVLADTIRTGIDAMLLPPPLTEAPPVLELLQKNAIPTAVVTAGMAEPHLYAVHIDDYAAARAMTGHLIALGHRRIGFIKGAEGLAATKLRLGGFVDALGQAGIVADEELIVDGCFTFRSGLAAAERLLTRADVPTAVFASNDDMAAAVIAVAHRLGLDVPADVTVCGCDDTKLATAIWPELTTIRQPLGDMARSAIGMLIRAVRNGNTTPVGERHQQFPFDLTRRQSDSVPRRRR